MPVPAFYTWATLGPGRQDTGYKEHEDQAARETNTQSHLVWNQDKDFFS